MTHLGRDDPIAWIEMRHSGSFEVHMLKPGYCCCNTRVNLRQALGWGVVAPQAAVQVPRNFQEGAMR